MNCCDDSIKKLLRYHNKYGQRRGEPWSFWILKKRTINVAFMVCSSVERQDFVEFEEKIYFPCKEKIQERFQRLYEGQLEAALLRPEEFVQNLDSFFMKTCLMVEQEHLYREFYNFCAVLEQQRAKKHSGQKIFDAYVSLVMQQAAYFCRNNLELSVVGISRSGELIFKKNPHPYSDLGNYELEKYYPDIMAGRRRLTPDLLRRAYGPYGYSFTSVDEVGELEALIRIYDNNNYALVPYIDEKTICMQVEIPYQQYLPEFPRIWKHTEVYREKLKRRNYMIPTSGVIVELENAADIMKIMFMETMHNEQIVMLYRVFTYCNGELSGFYLTRDQAFYSIYQYSNQTDCHDKLENFILELYMILTCDYEVDRKKNYAVRQVTQLKGEFHYPFQPLAVISYKEKKSRRSSEMLRNYRKEEYQAELREHEWFIRNLPAGQHASDAARQNALEKGYDLPEGKTFVQNFHYHVYRRMSNIK